MSISKWFLAAVATIVFTCDVVHADEFRKTCTFVKLNIEGIVQGDPPQLTLTTGFFGDKMT